MVARVVGSVLEATVARYPGTTARRARFVDEPAPVRDAGGPPAGGDVDDALERWDVAAWAAENDIVTAHEDG